MRDAPLILVSSSDRKRDGGTSNRWISSFPAFDDTRHRIIDTVDQYLAVGGRYSPSGKTSVERLQRNQGLRDRPTMRAIDRYHNSLFRELDYPSRSLDMQQRIDQQLLVISGMWGMVRPTDMIADYQLPITAKVPPVGSLVDTWQPLVSVALTTLAADRVVWDFQPANAARVWTWADQPRHRRHITVRFRDDQARHVGQRTVDDSERPRGAIVAAILKQQATTYDQLEGFTHPSGYYLDMNLSFTNGSASAAIFRRSA